MVFNFSLLNQNVYVILSVLVSSISTYIILSLAKKWFGRPGLILLGICLAASFIVEGLTELQFSTSKLPTLYWLMIVPLLFTIGLIYASWHNNKSWIKWLAIFNSIAGLLLSAVLINGYYNFYPTIASVFGIYNGIHKSSILYSQVDANVNNNLEKTLFKTNYHFSFGRVSAIKIPGIKSHFKARTAYVYVPPIDRVNDAVKLPVIVLTSGMPGLPSNWIGSGVETTLNNFAAQNHGITPIVFMVDNSGATTNDTECVNSSRGNVETYLTVDVPNYIKAHYNVFSSSKNWALGGLSMGGMCSIMLALRHPNVYNNFIDLGGEIGPEVGSVKTTTDVLFHGSTDAWADHQPMLLLKSHKYVGMGGFFGVGSTDNPALISGLKTLYALSKSRGIDSAFNEVNGGHTFAVWRETFRNSLPWISKKIGAT